MKRLLCASLALVAACGSSKKAQSPASSADTAARAGHVGPPAPDPAQAPARSHLIGSIARKAIGPFLGRSPFGSLAAWITESERGGVEELAVVPMGQDGAAFGSPHVVATVPQEATSLIVRPTGSAHGGWLLVWSALLDRGESLSVLAVAPDGTQRANPFDIQRTSDHVKWADIVPTTTGGTCVWAEETPGGDANILVAAIDSEGKPRGMPVRVEHGVVGWAAVPDGDGIALALVKPSADASSGAGTVAWWRLDADGRPRSAPVAIGTAPTVSGDVDVARAGDGWLLAWTDRTGEDAQITLASIDGGGHVTGPRHAMDAVGGAALVALASGPAGAALAWEEPRSRVRSTRAVHLASVTLDGPTAHPITSIDIASSSAPEWLATEHGFALLATAPACGPADGRTCGGWLAPSFVRFDPRLVPTQTEPELLGDARSPAALGWNLRCLGDACVSLAADTATPTGLYSVDLSERTSPFRAPSTPPLPANAPRVAGVATVSSGQPFSDIATARIADATLLATITSAVDARAARDPRDHAHGATIVARVFDRDGRPLGPAATITSRALAVGGLAVAAGAKPEDGAAIAWVARDSGDPQVHIAHVDARGHRTNEVQLTTDKGDASDVALAWAGDGWLVAWVDTRSGNGDVYATKVDRDLQRIAREERITTAPGDAGDVALAVNGDTAWLAWSDPRESPQEGIADIYATTLRVRDAKRAGDEVRVLQTAAHSRSPKLVTTADSALVAWIEDAPQGLDARGNSMLARLDATGHVLGRAITLPLAGSGNPTALALAADATGPRVFIARAAGDDVTIDAVGLRDDGSSDVAAWSLMDLDAPGSFEVALSASGDALFFDDVGSTAAHHRVRRAVVAWRR